MRIALKCILIFLVNVDILAQDAFIADSLTSILSSMPSRDSIAFEIHHQLGFYHPDAKKALYHSLEALKIADGLGSPVLQARSHASIGLGHRLLGNKVRGFESSFVALQLFDSLNLSKQQAALLLQIGTNYTADHYYDKAIQYFKQSQQLFIQLNDKYRLALVNINMGEAFRSSNILDSAEVSFSRALKLNEVENRPVIEAYSLGNLGMTHHAQGKLDEAMTELVRSIEILNELGDPASVVIYEAEIGQILIKQGQQKEGFQKIEDAFELAKSENLKEQIRDISKILVGLYSENKLYSQAFFYQQQFQVYQDSLVNAENIRSIEQTKARYDLDKQASESTAILKQKEMEVLYTTAAAVLLLLVVGLVYYAYRGKKKANLELNRKNEIIHRQVEEKELLHKEIHHRVKNNLQLIGSIMGLQSQTAEDQQVSDAMSTGKSRVEAMTIIHQNLYAQKHVTHINIREYLEKLVDNLESTYEDHIQSVTLEALDVNITADDSIPIGLIVNEAVCNAVKYKGQQELVLQIIFSLTDKGHVLSISDNGPGFVNGESKGTGFGTKLINTLARQLRADLNIESTASGTSVTLILKDLLIIMEGPHLEEKELA